MILNKLKIAVLTSSRADYGIYLPLLKALNADPFFDLSIIAFGTHLSPMHGETVQQIYNDGFERVIKADTMPQGDSPADIVAAMGKTLTAFSNIWPSTAFDLVVALGDRYEMFAACASTVPFGIPVAHIHGGETTLGAIDDAFRHSITQMASYHFATTEAYAQRVEELKGSFLNVFNVGALSIDNLKTLPLLSIDAFRERFNIDLSKKSILITFHPETVAFEQNRAYVAELIAALTELTNYQLIITMPNADTMGNMVREALQQFIANTPNAIGVESFGALEYLSCMKHCAMMLGNTSSGFVEAAFFPKWVINLGERQRGRILTPNILQTPIDKTAILNAVRKIANSDNPKPNPIYGTGNAAQRIVTILKEKFS
jgi:GDP/UDP-N,N'-diacetylbacillosamine 2-epimerase (hydrolysing)